MKEPRPAARIVAMLSPRRREHLAGLHLGFLSLGVLVGFVMVAERGPLARLPYLAYFPITLPLFFFYYKLPATVLGKVHTESVFRTLPGGLLR